MIEAALDDLESSDRHLYGLRMILVWPIIMPDECISLLGQQVPEAIAILGRYVILLHSRRFLWQVKEVGAYLLNFVSVFWVLVGRCCFPS